MSHPDVIKKPCTGGPAVKPCRVAPAVQVFGAGTDGSDEYLCWRHLAPALRDALRVSRHYRIRGL